ncbi:MAG: hypothetical protein PHQ83_11380 [Eubacteriales bacterium]|nr:hypothetical protein [Eubacteriales bacterium]
MSDPLTLFLQVLPIILLISLGMLLRQTRFLKPETVEQLKQMVLSIGLPALLFQAFASTTLNQSYLAIVATVFVTCLVLLGAAILVLRLMKVDNPFAPALFTGFETGMIGYALYLAVFGQSEVFRLAIVDLGQVTFVFFVLVTYISRQNGNRPSGWQLIRSFLLSPVILAILLGILVSLTGLSTLLETTRGGQMVATTLQLLGNLTVPLITIAIGFELHLGRATLKAPLLAALVRILILFALATLINKVLIRDLLHLEPQFETALMTLFLLPPPFVIPILMREKRPEHRQFVLGTLSIHIIL